MEFADARGDHMHSRAMLGQPLHGPRHGLVTRVNQTCHTQNHWPGVKIKGMQLLRPRLAEFIRDERDFGSCRIEPANGPPGLGAERFADA